MNLTSNQITSLLTEQPKLPRGHQAAIQQQERVKLHSLNRGVSGDASLKSKHVAGSAFTDLTDWMRRLLPRDKARVAMNLIRFPLDSVALSGEIYQELGRAFDGVDAREEYEFRGEGSAEDWKGYRAEALGGREGWRTDAMQTLRSRHNGIMVVDLPDTPNESDERPAPYFYTLDLERAHCYEIAADGCTLEYLVTFDPERQENHRIAYVFDDVAYRIVHVHENQRVEVVAESFHDLGHCPARMFWAETSDVTQPALRQHPMSDYLGAIDRYQLNCWFSFYGDLFNGWPITTTFQQSCNYRSETEYCDEGYLRSSDHNGSYLYDSGDELALCPKCKDRNAIGPGTNYEVPTPNPANGNTNMLPAVGLTTADVNALRYHKETVEEQARKIFAGVVGSVFDAVNNQAVNEKQVASLFEARRNVIRRLSSNLESLQSWVETTVCRLRYGNDFVSLSISYGTEWFLFDQEDLLAMYHAARDAGAGPALLDELQLLYFATRHRRQPRDLDRAKLIFALDPARHVTGDALQNLLNAGGITSQDYALKVRLSSLLGRFERQHGPIVDYRASSTLAVRVAAIRTILLGYLIEEQPQEPTQETTPPAGDQIDNPGQRAPQPQLDNA